MGEHYYQLLSPKNRSGRSHTNPRTVAESTEGKCFLSSSGAVVEKLLHSPTRALNYALCFLLRLPPTLCVSVRVVRYERLEDQLNDLTELHQNETSNLKQELASIEEKVAYQAYERARDIQVLFGVQTLSLQSTPEDAIY